MVDSASLVATTNIIRLLTKEVRKLYPYKAVSRHYLSWSLSETPPHKKHWRKRWAMDSEMILPTPFELSADVGDPRPNM